MLDQFIKVWSAQTGRPERFFSGVFASDVTSICLDKSHRRIVAGDGDGVIKILDVVTGTCLYEMPKHTHDVVYVNYNVFDRTVLTVGREAEVRISKDFKRIEEEGERELVRCIRGAHKGELVAADYHPNLDLVATGCLDGYIRIW